MLTQLVQDASRANFVTEDGDSAPLELMPPLSAEDLAAFELKLPCPLPADVRKLLSYSKGFSGSAVDIVDFTGDACFFAFQPVFPHGHPFAADGYGNFWVVDLLPSSTTWGPIYFACHDPPVILYQSPNLEHFLVELFKCEMPPHKSAVDDVHEDRLFQVWAKNPDVLSHEESLRSPDPDLAAFAIDLGSTFQFVDLRNPQIGFGFSWGRYGPNTVVRRFRDKPIFAYQKPKSFLRKLLGRSS